jgi:hypothetical protein
MMKFIAPFALATIFVANAQGASLPFNPIPLSDYVNGHDADLQTRLPITLAIEDSRAEVKLGVAGIVICSKSACYRPNMRDIRKNFDGGVRASTVVDATIPFDTIDELYIETAHGSNVSAGSIKLDRPLNITQAGLGREILVTFRTTGDKSSNYKASFATSTLYHETRKSIYYVPNFQTVSNLEFGAVLTIPAGASDKPEIFSVITHDIGDRFPLIDIYPTVQLLKPAKIAAAALPKKTTAQMAVPRVPYPSIIEGLTTKNQAVVLANGNVERTLSKTGVLHSTDFETQIVPNVAPRGSLVTTAYDPGVECALMINRNLQYIQSFLSNNGVVYLDWCLNIPPYMHITLIKMNDSRIRYSIPYEPKYISPGVFRNKLLRIYQFSGYAITAINGFTWEGDYGITQDGTGAAKGYAWSNGVQMGGNRVGGGAVNGSGQSDGNKFFIAHAANAAIYPMFGESATPNLPFGSWGRPNVVSSSTSLMRDHWCVNPSTVRDRWSAMGIDTYYADGTSYMVFMSSRSGSDTNNNEMCQVFRGFNFTQALRLDGSSSASMLIDNRLVNPLTGTNYFIFGSARGIAYPLKISW